MNKSDRDFIGDLAHENGNYECVCHDCGKHFQGHKRRVTCRMCTVAAAIDADLTVTLTKI